MLFRSVSQSRYGAEILRKQRQATFTLEKCVEKYGEKDGYKRWMDRQRKWLNTLDNLPIEEKARIARAKTLALTNSYSQISKTLFESIIQNQPELARTACYGTNELIIHTSTGGHIRPDFTVAQRVIEFNGDFWHANPKQYMQGDMLKFPGGRGHMQIIRAEDIWLRDANRYKELEQQGYKIMVVWESDYKKDKEGTIQKCLDFLNS